MQYHFFRENQKIFKKNCHLRWKKVVEKWITKKLLHLETE